MGSVSGCCFKKLEMRKSKGGENVASTKLAREGRREIKTEKKEEPQKLWSNHKAHLQPNLGTKQKRCGGKNRGRGKSNGTEIGGLKGTFIGTEFSLSTTRGGLGGGAKKIEKYLKTT